MNDLAFSRRVAELDIEAQHNPAVYRTKVGLIALSGYAYLFFILFAVIGAGFGLIYWGIIGQGRALAFKLAIPFGIFGISILRALWIRFPEPEGVPADAKSAPHLFAEVESIRNSINGPRVHRVLMSDSLNAAIVQVPKLGILGWQKNFLILGLPLLQSFSLEEVRFVIAHEFGHLSGNHGRFSGWLYRVRGSWIRLLELREQQESGQFLNGVVTGFVKWYVPHLSAYTFVLSRQQEYEADKDAAALTSPEIAATALKRLSVLSSHQADFWNSVRKEDCRTHSSVPDGLYARLVWTLKQSASPEQQKKAVRLAFADDTDSSDTHPCLRERVERFQASSPLDLAASSLPDVVQSASSVLLGDKEALFMETFNQQWSSAYASMWAATHQAWNASAKRRFDLEQLASRSPEQEWERLELIEMLEGSKAALPQMETFIAEHPKHAEAVFSLALTYLSLGNPLGVSLMERAVHLKPDLELAALHRLQQFERERDNLSAAREIKEKALAAAAQYS
jgi:Zn-dependent protease with chaperone function